ncbi:MAG: hypothetical protein NVS2B11_07080 [Acetobacteraceae bacterium]
MQSLGKRVGTELSVMRGQRPDLFDRVNAAFTRRFAELRRQEAPSGDAIPDSLL